MTALATRKRHPLARKPARKRHDLSTLVARWAARQAWRGCAWCAVQGGRHGKAVTVRSARRVAAPVRTWTSDRARFGTGGAVACDGCGQRIRMDRQHEHSCVVEARPPDVARFSGDTVRADEPIKATAVRLDQPHHDQPFATRQSWAAKPRLAEMSDKEFRAYAAELREKQRARREDAVEAELHRRAGSTPPPPPDLDEDGQTGTTDVVVPLHRKEVTMTEPKDWANSAAVFGEHGIGNTEELIAFLEQTAQGGNTLVEHLQNFAEAMNTANVDDGVVGSLGEAADAARTVMERLVEAHKKAADCYGDITQPDFSKAS